MYSKNLEIKDLSIGYRDKLIAEKISLALTPGVVTALIGRNGIGKSTFIKTLTGNIPPLSGVVEIEGTSVHEMSRKKLARNLAVVTTDPNMTGGLRVSELVALGRLPYTGALGRLSKEDSEQIARAMETVGIIHKRDAFVGQLSDGERQKAMIARGLAQTTSILIMDEPFSHLDVASRIEITEILNEAAKIEGKTILYSTHEVSQAMRMIDHIWLMIELDGDTHIMNGSPKDMIEKGYMELLFQDKKVVFNKVINDYIIEKNEN